MVDITIVNGFINQLITMGPHIVYTFGIYPVYIFKTNEMVIGIFHWFIYVHLVHPAASVQISGLGFQAFSHAEF